MSRQEVSISLNGEIKKITGKYVFLPLSDYLRYERSLTGTKVVCSEGDCGACTVMFKRAISSDKFLSINACIVPVMLMDGCHIITVEGLKEKEHLSEIQESMVRNFGAQCGFCTPGFIMSLANMFEQSSIITEQKVKNYLTGNLCRCTGYQAIIDAALDVDIKKVKSLAERFNYKAINPELIEATGKSLMVKWESKEFYAPKTLKEAILYKVKHPNLRIFSGATDLGVQINKGKDPGNFLMSLHLVKELYELKMQTNWVKVGAKVTLNDLQNFVEKSAPSFSKFLNIFASPQIKNTATLVGNVANGSPIADTIPYLLTAEAQIDLIGEKGTRSVALEDFITGYKTFDLKESEFITHIRFKILDKKDKAGLYKVSQRRDLDISCVNSSFVVSLNGDKIEKARIAIGGVGPKTLRIYKLENELINKSIDKSLIEKSKKIIAESITPLSDARGTNEFRTQICQNLFDKFIQEHF